VGKAKPTITVTITGPGFEVTESHAVGRALPCAALRSALGGALLQLPDAADLPEWPLAVAGVLCAWCTIKAAQYGRAPVLTPLQAEALPFYISVATTTRAFIDWMAAPEDASVKADRNN